ncbi:AAA family ATPase [Globicatella sanguinis]|uniref:AAA family ATPase n=1 Tax=Globicatella sanguinis TaxID=13076 RepID=UPI0025434635|nr:AAA family ATPase [Globicatella sanguinis]MDK7631713.1 AAA family ATPase [Globicatella sanguinis]WIK67089.1 AAA family ATPase [Globicatella sanguinis]WKT56494.1 AAA family ATPase [Globicatella sanguinis]
MKVIKIDILNHPLFEEKVEVNFLLDARVTTDEKHELLNLFNNYYLNYTYTFTGLNASGKTQLLNTISFALNLLQAQPINYRISFLPTDNILNLELGQTITFVIYFYENLNQKPTLNRLETTVSRKRDELDGQIKYIIEEEYLTVKKTTGVRTKKDIFNFEKGSYLKKHERNNEDVYLGLSQDVSMMNVFYKKNDYQSLYFKDMVKFTNFNFFSGYGSIPEEIIKFLDPSIEKINFISKQDSNEIGVEIHFKNQDRIVKLNSVTDIHTVLSSGTVKGMSLFMEMLVVLEKGGVLIVDELENHFNREIAATLIKFFLDRKVNTNGAILIYTTHYAELLDMLDRNDAIFIVKKQVKINVEKLSASLKRNDVARSDQFIKGVLENTAPDYEAKMKCIWQ